MTRKEDGGVGRGNIVSNLKQWAGTVAKGLIPTTGLLELAVTLPNLIYRVEEATPASEGCWDK